MNSNNWLSFPLSPTSHSTLPPHLQAAHSHHFSLGLINDNLNDNPIFHHQGKFFINALQSFLKSLLNFESS